MTAISCGKRPPFLLFLVSIPVLCPILIHIMLVFALWAAKYIIGSAGNKSFLAVFAEPQRFFLVSQHKAEHELNCR